MQSISQDMRESHLHKAKKQTIVRGEQSGKVLEKVWKIYLQCVELRHQAGNAEGEKGNLLKIWISRHLKNKTYDKKTQGTGSKGKQGRPKTEFDKEQHRA